MTTAKKRSRSLLIRWGDYEFSAARCRNSWKPATMPNGEHGRTFWFLGLCWEIRWGRW